MKDWRDIPILTFNYNLIRCILFGHDIPCGTFWLCQRCYCVAAGEYKRLEWFRWNFLGNIVSDLRAWLKCYGNKEAAAYELLEEWKNNTH